MTSKHSVCNNIEDRDLRMARHPGAYDGDWMGAGEAGQKPAIHDQCVSGCERSSVATGPSSTPLVGGVVHAPTRHVAALHAS
jgi:hypothetical protein